MGYAKTHPLFVATAFCSSVNLFKLVVPNSNVFVLLITVGGKSFKLNKLLMIFIRD